MPTQTPNLKLDTYNNTTDSQSKFQTFRTSIAGDQTSNMTKIDKWAGDVNTKLTSLENNKPTILVKANWISVGYYEAISSDIVDFKLDMLVTVKLNQDNDGTLTMKINELTVKSFLKYDTTGTLVNLDVGDLRKDREYQFRYDGTAFVWQGGTSADQLNIVGTVGNIVSVADDNTIKDSGVSVGTGALSTTDKTVVGGINELDTKKIDKTQIKNTLTETVEGNVLDATQGKILDDKFSILSDKVNWQVDNWKTENDLTTAFPNKSTTIFSSTVPFGGLSSCVVITTKLSQYTVKQEIFRNGSSPIKYRLASSVDDGTWGGWQTVATTDKIDILFTPSSGISVIENKSYRINDVLHYQMRLAKDTPFIIGTSNPLGAFSIPAIGVHTVPLVTSMLNNSSVLQSQNSMAYVVGGGLQLKCNDNGANQVQINGVMVL